jgi:hypothetical protein
LILIDCITKWVFIVWLIFFFFFFHCW